MGSNCCCLGVLSQSFDKNPPEVLIKKTARTENSARQNRRSQGKKRKKKNTVLVQQLGFGGCCLWGVGGGVGFGQEHFQRKEGGSKSTEGCNSKISCAGKKLTQGRVSKHGLSGDRSDPFQLNNRQRDKVLQKRMWQKGFPRLY